MQSEESSKLNEIRYRSFIEQASDAIMITDFNGNFNDVNESLCKMFGYTKEELLHMNIRSLIDPEELKVRPIKFDVLAQGQHIFNERRMMHKNGTIIEVEANVKRITDDLVLAIARDITERKKAEQVILLSEQKYKLLFFENPLPMLMMSIPELYFIDVNQAAIEQYGYSRKEFLAMTALDIRPREDIEAFLQAVHENDGGIKQMGIFRHKKKDGSIIRVEITTHRIVHEGKPAWLALANNVTEKFLAEEKLQQSHKDLRRLTLHLQTIREEERTAIAREVHDELGQQLTGLKMDIAWVNKKIPPENKAVLDKVAQILSLVDETVKTVRHISSELRPGILDDLGIIDALDWQSTEFEKRTGIRCRFSSSFNEMDIERGLSTGIFRVYQETLTNVARHAGASEVSASFELDNNDLVLKVLDNGNGFDEREVKSKKTLGLLGMRERATMFGGKITIESEKGKGTAVILQVPLSLLTGETL